MMDFMASGKVKLVACCLARPLVSTAAKYPPETQRLLNYWHT